MGLRSKGAVLMWTYIMALQGVSRVISADMVVDPTEYRTCPES
jgi:hypothetical protein